MRCLTAVATSTAISVLACAVPAQAEEGAGGVYKCTDEYGAVTYSTSPCKGAKREFLSKEKLEGKISTIEFPKPAAAAAKPAEAAAAEPAAATPASRPATPASVENSAESAPVITRTLSANPQIRKLPVGGRTEPPKK